MSPDTRIRRAEGLFQGIVRGRRYVHNPRGRDALAVLSARGAALLDHADGRPIGEIARALGLDPAALDPEVRLLARNGFIVGDGLSTMPSGTPPKRLDLWIHVTNDCNLDCPYCYIGKDHHHLSDDTADALLDALVTTVRAQGLRQVHARFAGGEPMLRFAFIRRFFARATERLADVGATFSAAILTNGTVHPDGALDWIKAHKVGVSVSLDGVGPVQDAMRPTVGGGPSFARVSAGLDKLAAAGISPYILITVTARNLDGVPELTDFLLARALGFRYSLVRDLEGGDALLESTGAPWRTTAQNGLVSLGRRASVKRAPVLEGEGLERVQRVFERCYRAIEAAMPVRPSFRRTHRFCDLEINRPLTRACGAGDRYLAIGDRGTVSPCQAALHHEGTAPLRPDTDLLALAPTLAHLGRNHPRTPNDTCAACRFKHSCAGGCPLLLHRRDADLHGRSPYCEVFRFVLPKILRIAALEVLLTAEARAT